MTFQNHQGSKYSCTSHQLINTYQAYLYPVEPQCNYTTVSWPAKNHYVELEKDDNFYLVTLQVNVQEGDRYCVNSQVPLGSYPAHTRSEFCQSFSLNRLWLKSYSKTYIFSF